MYALVVVSAIGAISSLLYYAIGSFAALRFRRAAVLSPPALAEPLPRLAMLKPLYRLDQANLANLETFLQTDYPSATIIIGVATYPEWAVREIDQLARRYPDKRIIVVTDAEAGCANRKVAKLIRMVDQVPEAEVFVVSDGDIVVERDYLRRLTSELFSEAGVGVVTCAYRARPTTSLAARFEALYVNTDFAPMVMLAELLEPLRHAYGASIAFHRAAMESFGRFQALKDVLADDFFLGRMAAEHGFKVKLSRALVTIACGEARMAEFWTHQLRWARTYRTTRAESVATIIVNGPLWALILMLASRFAPFAVLTFAIVIAARIAMSALMIDRVLGLKQMIGDAILVPVKDLVMAAIWFVSLLSNEVTWGGRRFRILSGGAMQEIDA
jgi:ceramide glucosyltransferase